MKNVSAKIVKFTSKKDNKEHEALQFFVQTSAGVWSSGFCFPSPLEFQLVKKAISENSFENDLSSIGYFDEN